MKRFRSGLHPGAASGDDNATDGSNARIRALLRRRLKERAKQRTEDPFGPREEHSAVLLQRLRATARSLTTDLGAADRLVERTLVFAMRAQRDPDVPLSDWLGEIMQRLARQHRRKLMH